MTKPPILTHVEFRSDNFSANEGEQDQMNPNLWGRRLASFLREKLLVEGFETEEPVSENLGWHFKIVNKDFSLLIWLRALPKLPDGSLCFIEPHKTYVYKLFRKVDTRERFANLQRALDKVLVEIDGIRAKRWWTYEEFNNLTR